MNVVYTLATADPKPTVVILVANATTAADVINETVKWAKLPGNVQVEGWSFRIDE